LARGSRRVEVAENLDPVISAVAAVHAALKDLDTEDRKRVLASVGALLGVPTETGGGGGEREFSDVETRERVEPSARTGRRLSLIELMQEKSPSTNAQKITLFAYYRDKHENKPRFERDDLKAYFGVAKESPPANYDRDFVNAVKNGWVHEEGDDSYITSKGIEVVESGFVGERKSTKKKTSRGRQSGRRKTGAKKATPKKQTVRRKKPTSRKR
jgi:hypothetical protein